VRRVTPRLGRTEVRCGRCAVAVCGAVAVAVLSLCCRGSAGSRARTSSGAGAVCGAVAVAVPLVAALARVAVPVLFAVQ
jgi:hypothetical protein